MSNSYVKRIQKRLYAKFQTPISSGNRTWRAASFRGKINVWYSK